MAVGLAHQEEAFVHALVPHLGAAAQGVEAAGAGAVLVHGAAAGRHEGTGLAGAFQHAQQGQGEARVGEGAHAGEVVEEGLAGHIVHMAAQAQHVIGGQGQGQFRTAAVEAGNFGMAGKAEGLARFQLGQVFHEFAAGVFFHDAFSCWRVVGAGQRLGKISLIWCCPACLYPLPGFAANFFVPRRAGCGAAGDHRILHVWRRGVLRAWWNAGTAGTRAGGLGPGVLSRGGPDARSRRAGCGAGAGGAGLRDAGSACCGSRRSPCVRDCPAIAAGPDGRRAWRRTRAAGRGRWWRPHW